jgi:hypothetical protein
LGSRNFNHKTKREKRPSKIAEISKKINLIPWSETEYRDIVNKVYRENPAVEFSEIDVSNAWMK